MSGDPKKTVHLESSILKQLNKLGRRVKSRLVCVGLGKVRQLGYGVSRFVMVRLLRHGSFGELRRVAVRFV